MPRAHFSSPNSPFPINYPVAKLSQASVILTSFSTNAFEQHWVDIQRDTGWACPVLFLTSSCVLLCTYCFGFTLYGSCPCMLWGLMPSPQRARPNSCLGETGGNSLYLTSSLYHKRRNFRWELIFVGKQHPQKLNPQNFAHTKNSQQ